MSDRSNIETTRQSSGISGIQGLRSALGRMLIDGFRRWQRQKAIAQLQTLDDRQLEDIGIARNDIPRVVGRLFRPERPVMRPDGPAEIPQGRQHLRKAA